MKFTNTQFGLQNPLLSDVSFIFNFFLQSYLLFLMQSVENKSDNVTHEHLKEGVHYHSMWFPYSSVTILAIDVFQKTMLMCRGKTHSPQRTNATMNNDRSLTALKVQTVPYCHSKETPARDQDHSQHLSTLDAKQGLC